MKLLMRRGRWSSLLLLTGVIALWGCKGDEETGDPGTDTPTNVAAEEGQIVLNLTGLS